MECAKNSPMGRKLKQAKRKKEKNTKINIEENNWPQMERVGWDFCVWFNSVWACDFFFFFSCACENCGFVFLQGRIFWFLQWNFVMASLKLLLVQLKRPHSFCQRLKMFHSLEIFHQNHVCSIDSIKTCHFKNVKFRPKVSDPLSPDWVFDPWASALRQVRLCSIYHCVKFVVHPGWLLPWLGCCFVKEEVKVIIASC